MSRIIYKTLVSMSLSSIDLVRDENFFIEDKLKINETNYRGYKANMTLRKCSARIIDKLSIIFPKAVYEALKIILEEDLKNTDWIIK